MDVERAIVTHVAQNADLSPLFERSIEPHHFLPRRQGDESSQPYPSEVIRWLFDHRRQYKMNAVWPVVQATFPTFEWWNSGSAIEPLIDMLHAQVMQRELMAGIRRLAELHDSTDVRELIAADVAALEVVRDLIQAVPTSNVTRLSDARSRLELYRERERTEFIPGVSLVLPELDEVTHGGIQGHELAIILGFLGIGKSSFTMAQCAKAYLSQDPRFKPKMSMVFSLEMEGEKLMERWDSMMAKFSLDTMSKLELTDEQKRRWEIYAERAEASKFERDIMVVDDIYHPTADKIFAEIERFRPDFAVVDTIDEIKAPSHLKTIWEQMAFAARELKGIARHTHIPIIGVAQAGRDAAESGATLHNIAGSIDIARKADIVIGLHANTGMKAVNQMEVRFLKNRRGKGDGFTIPCYWNVGTMTFRRWQDADAVAAPPALPQRAA